MGGGGGGGGGGEIHVKAGNTGTNRRRWDAEIDRLFSKKSLVRRALDENNLSIERVNVTALQFLLSYRSVPICMHCLFDCHCLSVKRNVCPPLKTGAI